MAQETSYASYLLRVWREGDGPETWQGEIESIQSGQKWQFDSLELIIGFLQTRILATPINDPDHKQD